MENKFLDAVIEQLELLKKEEEQPNVGKVISLVVRTAINQKLTFDVKRDIVEFLVSLDGITYDEVKMLRDLDNTREKQNKN